MTRETLNKRHSNDVEYAVSNEYVLVRTHLAPSHTLLPGCYDSSSFSRTALTLSQNVAFLSFLLFTTLQLFFAILAKSQAMMADCAAMYVDVVTYLFNFLAERLKHGRKDMSAHELRLRRLLLELVPPSISVITLLAVTILALRDAFRILWLDDVTVQPDLVIMLAFSALNLLLDVVNVGCFARVDQAVGVVSTSFGVQHATNGTVPNERTPLTKVSVAMGDADTDDEDDGILSLPDSEHAHGAMNLNMCSAWTHVCADTLRSVAVLISAGIAFLLPQVLTPADADSYGAIVVSLIILVSLVPLIQGLFATAVKIRVAWAERHHPDPPTELIV